MRLAGANLLCTNLLCRVLSDDFGTLVKTLFSSSNGLFFPITMINRSRTTGCSQNELSSIDEIQNLVDRYLVCVTVAPKRIPFYIVNMHNCHLTFWKNPVTSFK